MLFVNIKFLYSKTVDVSANGYDKIPHAEICTTVTVVLLNNNTISSLGSSEFSAYASLHTINLDWNTITSIPYDAFRRTALEVLSLKHNQLMEFPNLDEVAATVRTVNVANNQILEIPTDRLTSLLNMEHLILSANPLLSFPDVGNMGSNQPLTKLECDDLNNYLLNTAIPQTVCSVQELQINECVETANIALLPLFQCDSSTNLYKLSLTKCTLTNDVDLARLTTLGSKQVLQELHLEDNAFTIFPDLPERIRKSLNKLYLQRNHITTVNSTHVQSMQLEILDLSQNPLFELHYAVFSRVASLNVSFTLLPTDLSTWANYLAPGASVRDLSIDGTFNSLAKFRNLQYLLCSWQYPLNISMLQVMLTSLTS